MDAPAELPILYLDDAVVVVAKPSGLAVHKGWARAERYAMTVVRDQLGAWVYPAHRLDAATSGALLMALSPEDARALAAQFQAGRVGKRYLTLVRGVTPERFVVDRPLGDKRDKAAPPKPARTEVERLWVFERRYSWLCATPKSGRLHQIRRHLRGLGHPIIGDVRYGRGEENRRFRADFDLHRLALHAAALAFDHPRSGERVVATAAIPDDLRRPLAAMGAPAGALAAADHLCDPGSRDDAPMEDDP